MIKPYSKGYFKRCWHRTKFNDFLFTCAIIIGIMALFTIHSLALVACLCLIIPYCINRIPKIFNENMLYKSTVSEEIRLPVNYTPLNERAFHNEQGIYVFGIININGYLLELGKSYSLLIKGELIKVYLANYDAYSCEIVGIVFNDNNTSERKLVAVTISELKSQFTSPKDVECMYETDIGIRGMTKVAQDHYFK